MVVPRYAVHACHLQLHPALNPDMSCHSMRLLFRMIHVTLQA
jgi:hypothetical protein